MNGRMPNYVARRSLWLIPFGNRWSRWFWATTIALVTLILLHLNSFGHPLKILSKVMPEMGHTLYRVDAVPATCTKDGNTKYYTCWKCDKLFTDATCTKEIAYEDTIEQKLDHKLKTKEAAVIEGTGYQTIKHLSCTECNGMFDPVTKNQIYDVITPLNPLVADDCANNGKAHVLNQSRSVECDGTKVDFYHCSVCNKTFKDAAATKTFDYANYNRNHNVTFVPAKESTCTERGNIQYYKCTTCAKLYSDKNCANEVSLTDVQLPYAHLMGHSEAAVSTNTLNGIDQIHFCWKCDKMFADYDGEREIERPMTLSLLGFELSIWTLILAVHALLYIIAWTCVIVVIRCQYVEFYDDYVVRKTGVFIKRSRRTIFPQLTSVSSQKHVLNWGEVIIDVVGPWDVDLTDIARPGALRDYLLDHMVNSAAVENIGSNPYLATLAPSIRDDIYPGDRF